MRRALLIIVALFLMVESVNAWTYYVTKTGNNSNTGKAVDDAHAWATVQKGLTTAVAGDTVFIRTGVWDEASATNSEIWGRTVNSGFHPATSGTGGEYIVFKGYPGDVRPVILGKSVAGPPNSTFRPSCSFVDGDSYIVFDSLHFHKGYGGIHFRGSGHDIHDIIIRNCIIDSTLGCDAESPALGGDDNGGGILMYVDSYDRDGTNAGDGTPTVRNILIENNEIFANGLWRNQVAQYHMFNSSGMHMYGCDSCTIRYNEVYDQNAGIHFKHTGRFSEVYGNLIHDCEGPAMWDRHTGSGPTYGYNGVWKVGTRWHHNIVYNCAACFFIGIGSQVETTRDSLSYFYNNTCDCNVADTITNESAAFYGGVASQFGYMNECYFFNNIFYDIDSVHYIASDQSYGGFTWSNSATTPLQIYEDYNIFHGQGNNPYFIWGGTERTIAQWRAANLTATGMKAGQGVHDSIADPLFVDGPNHDYHLSEGSPAANGGKGGTFTFWRNTSREITVTLDSYQGALDPDLACTDTLVAPIFQTPSNSATGLRNPVVLDWSDSTQVGTPTGYDVQVDNNSDFSSVTYSSSPSASTVSVSTNLSASTTYYWRVDSRSCMTSPYSGYRSFTMSDCPDTVFDMSLTSPADGATNVSVTPTLDWPNITNATSYIFQVSAVSNFSSLFFQDTVSSSTGSVSGLSNSTTYYWRVRGAESCDSSNYSTGWSFTTMAPCTPPDAPTLSSPSDGATGVTNPVTLDWSDAAGATNYLYEVDNNSDFSSVTYSNTVTPSTGTVTGLSASTTYYWRVTAQGCDNTVSSTRSFTMAAPSQDDSLVVNVSNGLIDSWGYQWAATTNNGSATSFYISGTSGDLRTAWMLAPVTGFSGRTVTRVKLKMTRISSSAQDIYFYPLTQGPFVESQVTYNIYSTGNNWSTAGGTFSTCSGTYCDHLSTLGASSANQDVFMDRSSGGIVTIVQGWIDGTNLGVALSGPSGQDIEVASTENATSAYQPVWTIYFQPVSQAAVTKSLKSGVRFGPGVRMCFPIEEYK